MSRMDKEARRAYREAHKAEIALSARTYYQRNRDARLKYQREYQATHREQLNAYRRVYYAANKDKMSAQAHERYLRRKLALIKNLGGN